MTDESSRALARLRDPHHPAATELAGLVARQVRDVPLADLVPPDRVAAAWAGAFTTLASGDRLEPWLRAQVGEILASMEATDAPLRDQLLVGTEETLVAVMRQPFAPSEELLFRFVDQPALRSLVGFVLNDAIRAVGRRLGAGSESGLRGLFRSVKDNLGDVAGAIVDAVREEVDGVLDGRTSTAVRSVTERAVRTLAAYVADQTHAEAFAEMRAALTVEVLDTPVAELAAQGRAIDLDRAIADVVAAVRVVAERPDLAERLQADLERGLGLAAGRTLGQEIDALGLDAAWQEIATVLAEPAIRSLVATDEFAAFWERLHA